MKKHIISILSATLICFSAIGQTDQQLKAITTESDKQKTANSKDILTTLYRAGIDNLLGDDRSFTFSSSFFGIDSIFRKKGTMLDYNTERRLRSNAFNISLTGDENNTITKIGGGFTFTIINDKDIKTKSLEAKDLNKLQNAAIFTLILQTSVKKHIINDTVRKVLEQNKELPKDSLNSLIKITIKRVDTTITNSWEKAAKKHDYTKLNKDIKLTLEDDIFIDSLNADPSISSIYTPKEVNAIISGMLNGTDEFHEVYKNIAEKYARKPLWTFTPKATYDRIISQGEYDFATYFTVGLGKRTDRKPWEIEVNSTFKIANDTTIKESNYENKIFTISAGINKVLLQNEDKESKMEFKFFTQYDHQFGKLPPAVDKNSFTLNSTLRINVFKSLWLPLTLKYDPENGNFLGIFSVTANIGN